MHIPDGFLSANTWVSTWIISIGGIGYCIKKLSKILREKMIPLMGVMSAFIFAVQMLNFPIAAGTSGHLLGGVLAAVLLGPYGGAVVLAVVLSIQCLVFQDGGLTALGANMFNMSFIGSMGGYVIYNSIRRIIGNNKGVLIGTALAAWLSVVLASVFCAVELAISGTSPLQVVLPAMALVHILIGIGEAIISVLVVSFILKIRPDLIYNSKGE
ncbi:MAG: energy-coupling factor ABC transporter permease [Candidatus Omnitrophica bacterium]|nr:energy-coupling factor ABC transporter permease [Candidatus Omnitrophota bacterium]